MPAQNDSSNVRTRIITVKAGFSAELNAISKGRFTTGDSPQATSSEQASIDLIHDNTVGLALSGGGIRSATFCLGVLQAFAKCGKLTKIDYLSTVSGGGYIGAWLSAWIRRKGLPYVNQALNPNLARKNGTSEAPEVTWLRQYSNYLAPQLGMLSADSVTLVATWCRNVFLNLIILVSFLAVLFLIPRLLLDPVLVSMTAYKEEFGYAASWLGFFLFPLGICFQLSTVPPKVSSPDDENHIVLLNTTWGVLLLVVVPGLLTALFASIFLFSAKAEISAMLRIAVAALVLLVVSGSLWLVFQVGGGRSIKDTLWEGFIFLRAYVVALLVGVFLICGFSNQLPDTHNATTSGAAALLTFGPPAVLVAFGAVGSIIVGLVGRAYYERTREWWSRMNAWFAILGLVWLGLFALAFYATPVALWAYDKSGAWITSLIGAGWFASLLSTLFMKPTVPGDKSYTGMVRTALLNVALVIVVVGMLGGVAAGVGLVVQAVAGAHAEKSQTKPPQHVPSKSVPLRLEVTTARDKPTSVSLIPQPSEAGFRNTFLKTSFETQELARNTCWNVSQDGWMHGGEFNRCNGQTNLDLAWFITLACLLVLYVFSSRVDVNKFSLHNLYKNRLIRCYLGASRCNERHPHPFTGFDDSDDLSLDTLAEDPITNRPPVRPFHIINSALNITHGRNLAWQERKAASFTFSPLHCGFVLGASTGDAATGPALSAEPQQVGGYRSASQWASRGDEHQKFTLGMAMTTSGAAVSSIQGKGSKPALAFIMTVFNARLGRWSPNPLWRSGWRNSSPQFGLYYLLQELFGYSNEVSRFVYLSDGGHFDNTGIYELVRRRCKTIVAVDATADGERGMSDLANVVRKCRVDFGALIDIDLQRLGTSRADQASSEGYVGGDIIYGIDKNGLEIKGKLFVIKPTLLKTKELSVDIFGYSRLSESFPHQSTIDQFFSESQFESYRELGERIGTRCLTDKDLPL